MTSRIRIRIGVWLLCAVAGCAPHAAPTPPGVAVVRSAEFDERVAEYLVLRRRVAARLPAVQTPSDDPARLVERRRALAAAIRAARPDARQGTIFTPAVEREIRHAVRSDLKERKSDDRVAVQEEVPKLPFAVNDEYPEREPLATVPPMLLARLPQLPEKLEYRFIGRHLILLDVDATLIVDFIPEALPASGS